MRLTAKGVLSALFRNWRICLGAALAPMVLGALYLIFVTPLYSSQASVVVRFDERAVPNTDMARDTSATIIGQNDRHEMVLANAEILGSPDLARAVIEGFGLARIYPRIVANPPWLGTPLDEGVRVFLKHLNVEPGQQGDVIELSFMHPDPAMARAAMRQLIALYMKREGEIFSTSDFTFQQQQLDAVKSRLVTDQKSLQSFKAEHGISAFGDQITALIKQRGDTFGNLQSAQVSLGQTRERRDELSALLARVKPNVDNSATGEKYHAADDAQLRLADLRVKEQQMLTTYRGDSPLLDQLRASIASASADVSTSRRATPGRNATAANLVFQNIQTDLLRATAEAQSFADSVRVLTRQVADIEASISTIEATHTHLNDLERSVAIDDTAYRSLALHLEDSRVVANRVRDRLSHGAIISDPSLPYKAARPRYVITAMATIFAGILSGLAAVFGAEWMADRVVTAEQAEQQLGIPILASFAGRAS